METIKHNTIVTAVYFKKALISAFEELKKPEHRNIEKKITLSLLILAVAFCGAYFSIAMVIAGLQILEDSGISKVLLMRIIGSVICIAGVLAFKAFIEGSGSMIRDLIWTKEPTKNNEAKE